MKIKPLLILACALSPITLTANTAHCLLSDGINVHTQARTLDICKRGTVVNTFKIAIGASGVGKKKAGDNKTPTGLYGLAYPRKSAQFKIFIPILYPTLKQSTAGYTGKDVGIHGPIQSRGLNFLDHLPFATRGCIAVGKNNYIEYVANWVRSHPGTKVLIV